MALYFLAASVSPPSAARNTRGTNDRTPSERKKRQKSKCAWADFAASLSFSILYLSRRVKKPRRSRSRPKRKKSSDAPERASKDFSAFVKIGKVARLRRLRRLRRFPRQSSGLRSSLKSAVFVDLSTFCVKPDVAVDRYFASIDDAVTGSVTEPSGSSSLSRTTVSTPTK